MSQVFTHRDHVITVDESGKFVTEIDGKIVRRSSLTALKTLIDKSLDAIKIMTGFGFTYFGDPEPQIYEVIGKASKYKIKTKEHGSIDAGGSWGNPLYHYDQEIIDQAKKIMAEFKIEKERVKAQLSELLKDAVKFNISDIT